jgi:hypothetical protein
VNCHTVQSSQCPCHCTSAWRLTWLAPPGTCYPNCQCLLLNKQQRKVTRWGTVFLIMSRINGTAASEAPSVLLQVIHEWLGSIVGMTLTGDIWNTRIKTYLNATLSTTNPTSFILWTNAVFCDLTPASKRLGQCDWFCSCRKERRTTNVAAEFRKKMRRVNESGLLTAAVWLGSFPQSLLSLPVQFPTDVT